MKSKRATIKSTLRRCQDTYKQMLSEHTFPTIFVTMVLGSALALFILNSLTSI